MATGRVSSNGCAWAPPDRVSTSPSTPCLTRRSASSPVASPSTPPTCRRLSTASRRWPRAPPLEAHRPLMRVGITVTVDGHWPDVVDYVVEAERLGVAVCWTAEAWGSDAATPLAFLAARTERIQLGSGIMQLGARTPANTAMTALTLVRMSGNRFILGLGASGPQVMEGLHGVPFAHPLGRMRETIEIVRRAFAGERIAYDGRHFQLPLPDGQGKALRLSLPANPDIPIYLATLSPKMLELTGELANGWVGTSFVPEAASAYLDSMAI